MKNQMVRSDLMVILYLSEMLVFVLGACEGGLSTVISSVQQIHWDGK
jgi:hypothetical protein